MERDDVIDLVEHGDQDPTDRGDVVPLGGISMINPELGGYPDAES